jgi:hypothetical protein
VVQKTVDTNRYSMATINDTNTVLWHNSLYDRLHTWTTDANWSRLSSQRWIDPRPNDGHTLKSQFRIDLYHDSPIGQPPFSGLTSLHQSR